MEGSSRKNNIYNISNIFASLLLSTIRNQLVDSSSPSHPSPLIIDSQIDGNAETTSLLASGNGNFYNLTVLETYSSETSHKLPPSLVNISFFDEDGSAMQNSRLGLDIKEIVLTNLDLDVPMMRTTIRSHTEYSRENDEYEFLSRYLVDEITAQGKDCSLAN